MKHKNTKTSIYWKHFISILFSGILFITTNLSMAQGANGGLTINNCYQFLNVDDPTEDFNVLKGQKLWFNYAENYWPKALSIKTVDVNNVEKVWSVEDYNGSGLKGDYPYWFHPYTTDEGLDVVPLKRYSGSAEGYIKNRYAFSVGEDVKTIELKIWGFPENGEEHLLEHKVTMDVLSIEEAFSFTNPLNESCFTFENFHVNLSSVLDGFCGDAIGYLWQVPPLANPNNQIDPIKLEFKEPISLSTLDGYCESCINATASSSLPEPVPCGCSNFSIDINIKPCQSTEPRPIECPDLNFSLPIDICCDCDVRNWNDND
jgi:hypothetical protein